MKKKKEKLIRMTGVIILLAMMALNFIHAFNDYGFLTNPMSAPILGQFSSGTSTSTSTNEKVFCTQDKSYQHYNEYNCDANDRNSSCNYSVTKWFCAEGSGYGCKEGNIYSGYDCNTNYNSSNCGTTTLKVCN